MFETTETEHLAHAVSAALLALIATLPAAVADQYRANLADMAVGFAADGKGEIADILTAWSHLAPAQQH